MQGILRGKALEGFSVGADLVQHIWMCDDVPFDIDRYLFLRSSSQRSALESTMLSAGPADPMSCDVASVVDDASLPPGAPRSVYIKGMRCTHTPTLLFDYDLRKYEAESRDRVGGLTNEVLRREVLHSWWSLLLSKNANREAWQPLAPEALHCAGLLLSRLIDASIACPDADRAWRFGFGEAGTTTAGGEEEEADWTVFLDTDRERTRTLAWLGDAVLLLLLAAEGSKKLLRPSQLQRLAACLLSNENLSDGEPSPAKQHSRATKKEAAVGEAFAAWLQAEPDAVTRLEKALQDIRISAPDTDLQKPAPVCLAIRTAVRCCSEKRDAKQKEDARVSASPEVAGRNKSNRRRSKVKGR